MGIWIFLFFGQNKIWIDYLYICRSITLLYSTCMERLVNYLPHKFICSTLSETHFMSAYLYVFISSQNQSQSEHKTRRGALTIPESKQLHHGQGQGHGRSLYLAMNTTTDNNILLLLAAGIPEI